MEKKVEVMPLGARVKNKKHPLHEMYCIQRLLYHMAVLNNAKDPSEVAAKVMQEFATQEMSIQSADKIALRVAELSRKD